MAFRYNELGSEVAGGPFTKGRFAFPIEDRDRYASKIQFQVVKIIPPRLDLKLNTQTAEAAKALGESAVTGEAESEQVATVLESASAGDPATLQLGSKCDLYLPQSIQITDIIQYETPGLGAAGAVGLAALEQGTGLAGATAKAISAGTEGISDFIGAIAGREVSRLGAVRIGRLVPGETATNVTSLAAQAALNPNIRAMFKQVNLRRFTFNFKLIPVSSQESKAITDIVNFFRYHAYPEDIEVGSISLGYEYPELFRIKAFTKVNGQYVQNGTHMKDCYLESFSTTFNPTAATFHPDGTPTEVDIALNFVEHRTLSKKDIDTPFDIPSGSESRRVERGSPGEAVPLASDPPTRGSKFTVLNASTNTEGSF